MKQLRRIGTTISQLSYDVFLITLGGYLCALVVESMKAGTVVRYFNMNYLLIAVGISALLAVILPHPDVKLHSARWYYSGVVLLSMALGFIIFQITASMGTWAYVAGISCALLLCTAGIMIQRED
ncbi:MAG: hypothetical protein Q8P11_04315 [bacterium]|nr:hypothetical protein [bacterium]